MGKTTPLTQEDINNVISEYLDGWSVHLIGVHFHIGRTKVLSILQEAGIKLRTKEEQRALMVGNVSKTVQKKYGVDNAFQSEEIKNKIRETCLTKYGKEKYSQTDTYKQQVQETWTSKSQAELDSIRAKIKETTQLKYGVDSVSSLPWFRDKVAATNLERYGYTTVLKDKVKMRKAVISKYGVENVFQSDEIKEKCKNTMLERFGVEHYFQNGDNLCKSIFKKYHVDDIWFDSLPELCIWLYMTSNHINIERNTTGFAYNFDNQEHYCFPDFIIEGKFIEVKGDHLYKKMLIANTIEHAKLNCLLAHDVEIWISKDYNKYIVWFNEQGYRKEDFKNYGN